MRAWRADGLPAHPVRDTILIATAEHDNGWIEVDRAPILDESAGLPLDFVSLPDEVKQPIWPRAAGGCGDMAPLAGSLVAQHALTVLARHRADRGWADFFQTMERERARLVPEATADAVLEDRYRFVYLGDLASLVFCNGWTESFDAYGYRLTLRDSRLGITPNPFDGGQVSMRVPARRIPARRYTTQSELSDAFARAEVFSLTGQCGAS